MRGREGGEDLLAFLVDDLLDLDHDLLLDNLGHLHRDFLPGFIQDGTERVSAGQKSWLAAMLLVSQRPKESRAQSERQASCSSSQDGRVLWAGKRGALTLTMMRSVGISLTFSMMRSTNTSGPTRPQVRPEGGRARSSAPLLDHASHTHLSCTASSPSLIAQR
eukprot:3338936-Rhodomonas_salina.2